MTSLSRPFDSSHYCVQTVFINCWIIVWLFQTTIVHQAYRYFCIHTLTIPTIGTTILCIMLKLIAIFMIKLFARLHVKVGILLTTASNCMTPSFHLEGRAWAHKTSHFLLKYLYQARNASGHVYVFDVSILPLFTQLKIFERLIKIVFDLCINIYLCRIYSKHW